MKDGVIVIDKPNGMTSFDAVAKIRRLFGTRQVGHTGTLDPMATGVLVVMVGRAVKASEYLTLHDKRYEATLKLGITTDTEDTTGNILTENNDIPSFDEVKRVCQSFIGEIIQIPPMYSALKKDGKKLCDLARQGIEVEREGRPITVYSIDVRETEKNDEFILNVSCSKGTYIRTLCADIGKALGCGGAMASLRRTRSGNFSLQNSHTFEELESITEQKREELLLDTESLFSDCKAVVLPPFYAKLAQSGCEIYQKKIGTSEKDGSLIRMYDCIGFFSLGQVKEYPNGSAIKPIKKFRLE